MADLPPSSTSAQKAMSEEDFTCFNSLVENGDTEALERFITEKNITPEIYYLHGCRLSQFVQGPCGTVGLAAKCGHLNVMRKLISLGFSVNEKSFNDSTEQPIHIACKAGNVAMVKALVEDYGVDIHHRDMMYHKPVLCCAAANGKLEVIQYFADSGTDVTSMYRYIRTSTLHHAAENDQWEVCQYLLSHGADVNMGDQGNTPLNLAACHGGDATARVLIAAGADVNSKNDIGETPFLNAAKYGHISTMKLLVCHGADPDQCDSLNFSPLYHAVLENCYDVTHYLVFDLNVRLKPDGYRDESPFRVALRCGFSELIDLLLRAGYNPVEELEEFKDFDGNVDDEYQDEADEIDDGVRPTLKEIMYYMTQDERIVLQKKLKDLSHVISNPRSLQTLCVYTVRRLLGRRLSTNSDRLPICEPLKKKVMYCDVTV